MLYRSVWPVCYDTLLRLSKIQSMLSCLKKPWYVVYHLHPDLVVIPSKDRDLGHVDISQQKLCILFANSVDPYYLVAEPMVDGLRPI